MPGEEIKAFEHIREYYEVIGKSVIWAKDNWDVIGKGSGAIKISWIKLFVFILCSSALSDN